jgi:outer membrane receptor protein involved in Fe transport
MWGLNFQTVFTDRTFMELRASGWETDDDYLSATGSTEPAFIDYSPADGGSPTYAGGLLYPWVYESGTTQFDVTVSHFTDEFLKGDHDFKFGVRYGDGFNDTKTSLTGVYYYRYVYEYDYYGTIYPYEYFYRVDYRPYYYGSDQTALSAFVDDSWRINDRTTITLGLRFDRHDADYPAYPRLDPGGVPTGEIIPAVTALKWNNWSPRLGFAYNAGADFKTVIRGSFGIYYDGNVSGNWDSPPPDHSPWIYSYSTSPTGPWEPFFAWSPGEALIDPNLDAPQTTQFALGFERQFKENYSYGLSLVYKDTKDLIGFEHLGDGVYEEVPWVDPLTGQEFTLWSEIEPGTVRKGNRPGVTAGGTFDEYNQEYWGVILTFNRRFTDWWSLRASYTLSESTGLIPDLLDDTQFNPPYGNQDGNDPNNFINGADQHLQGDRKNMLRVQANFELPWNLHASTSVNLQDGRPYSQQAIARGVLNQGGVRFITIPASDSQRYPFQSLVDFSFGKRWNIVGDGILKTDIQVFNLLNDDAYDEFNGGGSSALVPDANGRLTPSLWVWPRRIMLRLGVEY